MGRICKYTHSRDINIKSHTFLFSPTLGRSCLQETSVGERGGGCTQYPSLLSPQSQKEKDGETRATWLPINCFVLPHSCNQKLRAPAGLVLICCRRWRVFETKRTWLQPRFSCRWGWLMGSFGKTPACYTKESPADPLPSPNPINKWGLPLYGSGSRNQIYK